MPIAIMSLDKARKLAKYHPDWDLVSILGPRETGYDLTPLKGYKSVLRVEFDDVLQADVGVKPATREIIEDIIAWCRDKDMDKLGVHCLQGISRSSAIAVVVACSRGRSPKTAFDELIVPGTHAPNTLVLSLGRDILGMPEIMDEYLRRFRPKGWR